MAALTATDWTLAEVSYTATAGSGGHYDHYILSNGKRCKRISMTLATAGTYPSGGVPLPTGPASYGMKNDVDYLKMYDTAQANVLIPKYSATGNVIRLYQQQGLSSGTVGNLIELATTATAGSGGTMILYVEAVGS